MLLGLSSFTYGWAVGVPGRMPTRPLDEHGLLDRCRDLGLPLLQVGDNLPLHTFDEARLDCFAERALREGVQLEVGTRRLTTDRVHRYLEIARRLRARLIRLVIDDGEFHPTPDAVIATLREVLPRMDGLVLGIENHDRFPAQTLRRILTEVGSDRLGICLDTANSLGAGEGLETVMRELGPLTVNLHLKDFSIMRAPHWMGFSVEGRPAGGGMLDIPSLLRELAPVSRCTTAVLELWTPPEPQLTDTLAKEAAWAAQSVRYLRPFFP